MAIHEIGDDRGYAWQAEIDAWERVPPIRTHDGRTLPRAARRLHRVVVAAPFGTRHQARRFARLFRHGGASAEWDGGVIKIRWNLWFTPWDAIPDGVQWLPWVRHYDRDGDGWHQRESPPIGRIWHPADFPPL